MTTFHELLRASAELHGPRTAIRFDEAQLSYEELLNRSEAVAAELVAAGVGPGDHVALVMDNSLECVLAWLASSLLGCTEIPINPQYRGDLLHYLLADGAATAVVCDAHYLARISEVASRLPMLRRVLVNGTIREGSGYPVPVMPVDFAASGRAFIEVREVPERIVLYTSGTTGPSKGVIHTQKSSLVLARYNAAVLGYDESDRLLNFFPLFHQNARYTGVMAALCVGASIRLERRLSTSTFWRTCDADGITAFNYLGSVLRMLLNVTEPERNAGSHTVRKAFGAGAAPGVWTEFEERLGIELYETYGLSEAPMATINVPSARSPRGSAGRASALFEVAVVDPEDNPLRAGDVGEIVMRPRGPDAIMRGYLNKDAATVEALRNLWFHSGDRGMMSADGDLYFEERAKDSIRRRGENISAWEVESVLEQHPAVAEAAVYGVSCPDADEEVAASIVACADPADLAEIHAFACERLPDYAAPTLMRLVPDLPRTPTEKVKKEELRAVPREDYVSLPPVRGKPESRLAAASAPAATVRNTSPEER